MNTINLEIGMPNSQDAIVTLNNRIYAERASRARYVKVIHGYGSTGKGGTIRKASRQKLAEFRRQGVIKAICPGENFGPFTEEGRKFIELCPELRKDIDWGRENPGITIVLFR